MSNVSEVFESMEYGAAPESSDQVMEWIDAHEGRFHHFIGGIWVPSSGNETLESVNPATGGLLATVPLGTETDVDRAVEAARGALDGLRKSIQREDGDADLMGRRRA